MSGAEARGPVRARFQRLSDLLLLLRIEDETIRTGGRLAADAAMVRQNSVISHLCELTGVMRAEGDFHTVDDLLAEQRDA